MDPRVRKILDGLHRAYPRAGCALVHRNPFELLAATILSAQCTDARVNQVTPALFARYPTPERLARAAPASVEAVIRSTGFFRQKAQSLIASARLIAERYGGRVPRDMDALLALRGVARKTANVVLGTGYGIAAGIVVDTHVRRLSHRLGLTRHQDPVKIEKDLTAVVPRRDWIWLSHALIAHGRALCTARAPRCGECPLAPVCPAAPRGAAA